jgi:hypothetical protein
MEPSIEFNPAAFKHGVSEADIRHALKTFAYEEPLEEYDNKHLVVGFDGAGNPLEIMYNILMMEPSIYSTPCGVGIVLLSLFRRNLWHE